MNFQERYDNFLIHYGVPGMKWGVRKEYVPHPRKRKRAVVYAGESQTSLKEKRDKANAKFSNKKVAVKKAFNVGVSLLSLANGNPFALVKLAQIAGDTVSSKKNLKKSDLERSDSEIDKKTGFFLKKDGKGISDKDVKAVNPGFDRMNASTTNNCVCCTAALEMRNRGYNVRAKNTVVGFTPEEVKNIYKGAQASKKIQASDRNYFISFNTKKATSIADSIIKDGGRGHLLVTWQSGGGHSVYYDTSGGDLKIYDGQVGKVVASSTKESIRYLKKTCSEQHIRVDNCQINMSAMKQMVE